MELRRCLHSGRNADVVHHSNVPTELQQKPLSRSEVASRAGTASAAKRRAQMDECREYARQLQAVNPQLATLDPEKLGLAVWHAGELGRLLTPAIERSDVFALGESRAS
jgi:hypothetical protein